MDTLIEYLRFISDWQMIVLLIVSLVVIDALVLVSDAYWALDDNRTWTRAVKVKWHGWWYEHHNRRVSSSLKKFVESNRRSKARYRAVFTDAIRQRSASYNKMMEVKNG